MDKEVFAYLGTSLKQAVQIARGERRKLRATVGGGCRIAENPPKIVSLSDGRPKRANRSPRRS